MDFDSLTPDPQPQVTTPAENPSAGALPSFDSLQDDSEKYGTVGQQIGTVAEGVAKGIAGPLATAAELGLSKLGVPGLSAEEQAGRAEANPWAHGISEAAGLVGGSLIPGLGEYSLGARAAEAAGAASEAANLGKIGSAALKGVVEGGIFQGSDEMSKAMLGQGDPEAPVASALAHMGGAALLGGGLGTVVGGASAGLKKLADSEMGQKAGQLMEDFGNRWKFNQENPSLFDAVKNEVHNLFQSTNVAADDVYGATGLKAQAIEKLAPQMNEAIKEQNQKIFDRLQAKFSEMIKDPESYPARLTKKLQSDMIRWSEVATNPEASSAEVFNATQELKQKLQAYSKFDKQVGPLSQEKDFINVAKELQHDLVKDLEDTKVWGKAGELQKGVNKAFSDFLPKHKDFLKKFATKLNAEEGHVIDPGKINTYVNQLGKPNAEIKQEVMKNYIDAAEHYRNKIADLHHTLGVENPIPPVSLNALKGTLNEAPSAGAELADKLTHMIRSKTVNNVASAVTASEGAREGYREQGVAGALKGGAIGFLTGHFGPIAARKAAGLVAPTLLKVLGSGETAGIVDALEHAGNVARGAKAMQAGVDSLFGGAQQAYDYSKSTEQREKLKKLIETGALNQQIQHHTNEGARSPSSGVQAFAKGGSVEKMSSATSGVETHFPEQNMLLQAAKGRVNNYLNSVRPLPNTAKLPFDADIPDKAKERSYNQAIDIANKPLSVLNHIKNGTVTPDHVRHLNQMYPEVYNQLSKKITEKIVDSQSEGSKPSYKIRQGMSLFLGAPIDSTMTPQAIQSAQSVFASQRAAIQPQQKASKQSPEKLNKVADSYLTSTQASEKRLNAPR